MFRCESCQRIYEIDDIYVGRRNSNWPKCMCKSCSRNYNISFKHYERSSVNIKRKTPLDILLQAGYPKEEACQIISKGL